MGALRLPTETPRPARSRAPQSLKPGQTDLRTEPRGIDAIERDFVFGPTGRAGTGWSQFSFRFSADRWRLSSGGSFYALTDYLMHQSQRGRKQGEELSFECEINIPELALLLRISERQINRELLYLQQRDMAIVTRIAGQRALVRMMIAPEKVGDKEFPGWSNISQSYCDWAAEQRQSLDEQADEAASEDEQLAALEKTYVKIRPATVKRGRARKQKVNGFVKGLQLECDSESPVDISLDGELVSGQLVLKVCGKQAKTSRSKSKAKPVKSTTSKKTSGHTRPDVAKNTPKRGGSKTPKRGGEISGLFDPILLKSCGKSLSADDYALKACCSAIADTPADFVARQVHERGRRSIQSPQVCIAICREIACNWKKLSAAHQPEERNQVKTPSLSIQEQIRQAAEKRRGVK